MLCVDDELDRVRCQDGDGPGVAVCHHLSHRAPGGTRTGEVQQRRWLRWGCHHDIGQLPGHSLAARLENRLLLRPIPIEVRRAAHEFPLRRRTHRGEEFRRRCWADLLDIHPDGTRGRDGHRHHIDRMRDRHLQSCPWESWTAVLTSTSIAVPSDGDGRGLDPEPPTNGDAEEGGAQGEPVTVVGESEARAALGFRIVQDRGVPILKVGQPGEMHCAQCRQRHPRLHRPNSTDLRLESAPRRMSRRSRPQVAR